MTYNTRHVFEQGGSMYNATSGASAVYAAGTSFELSGSMNVKSGGSIILDAGARLGLGNSNFEFGTDIPTHSTSPGTFYFRSDGSISNIYINNSDGTTGSKWQSASELS